MSCALKESQVSRRVVLNSGKELGGRESEGWRVARYISHPCQIGAVGRPRSALDAFNLTRRRPGLHGEEPWSSVERKPGQTATRNWRTEGSRSSSLCRVIIYQYDKLAGGVGVIKTNLNHKHYRV
ncbi:hypothetical protein AVEN_259290-1 [Araneus ventricosus]|uniref:Uncharacterized protein n=1 Tax=Araneus ventricosus TaxID=182803 RepID=A0A4Y2GJF5_ARAVE|nr:hypothetical protein AVEN_259290-1 [Araneus ventricosus]